MSALIDALRDVKEDVARGVGLEAALSGAARDYSVPLPLLTRKFSESYGSPEAVRALAAATNPDRVHAEKLKKTVADLQARYNLPPGEGRPLKFEGKTYTVICRFTNVRVRPPAGGLPRGRARLPDRGSPMNAPVSFAAQFSQAAHACEFCLAKTPRPDREAYPKPLKAQKERE